MLNVNRSPWGLSLIRGATFFSLMGMFAFLVLHYTVTTTPLKQMPLSKCNHLY